jgi:sterol desaturase/sphingolipid hydroxylase (fatty acid hydroxylase superfamily)
MTPWLLREIPPIPSRFRPLFVLYVAGFAVFYAATFVFTLHLTFLGPGLGDDLSPAYLDALLAQLLGSGHRGVEWFGLFMTVLTAVTAFRAWIVYRGFSDYRTADGQPFPLRDLVVFGLTNLLNLLFAPLLLLVLGGLFLWMGQPFEDGHGLLAALVTLANEVVASVPTVVELPRWLAFVCTFMVGTFVHYWLHRWSHTRRLLWLLLHRPHHMPAHLCYATTLPVFMSFPAFLLLVVPYVVLFGTLGKLFYPEPLYAEMIVFQGVMYVGEIFGHSPAVYDVAVKYRLARLISALHGQGLYHVMHHSAQPDTARKAANNTVNIGNGPFSCWDRLFGTFQPLTPTVPPMGLHGNPALVMNPLRLFLAGVLQIVHELHANRSWRLWWKILTGPADYVPPVSRDYLLRVTAG